MIDCDIHNEVPSLQTLVAYLPDFWQDYIAESAFVGPDANDYPAGAAITARPDAKPTTGGPAGADIGLLRQQLLDALDIEVGILNCAYRVSSVHHPDLAAALATAVNQWQVEQWLDAEPRLRASIVVASQLPDIAVAEIERWGEHPGFVQVILPVRSHTPYGSRLWDPIYAAATKHDLVVGIHYGGAPGHPSTPSGWPSTYIEEYAGMAQVFQSQVISLITEGAFDRFPTLRVALIEGGFTWMPSLMWRIDKEWKGLRHNIPWVRRPPSDYMREHIRLTTAPLDAPPTQDELAQIIEQMDSDKMLMFGSDYPHWHADEPTAILHSGLGESTVRKICIENAREFYRL